jgi:hypothetical protein
MGSSDMAQRELCTIRQDGEWKFLHRHGTVAE